MSPLFWFRPVFIVLLFLAEAFFCFKLNRRKGFAWKLPVCIAVCIGLAFAIPYKIDNAIYGAFMFFVLFALTLVTGIIVFDEPIRNILFCAIAGYTVQHIASELCELFNSIMVCYSSFRLDIYDIYIPTPVNTGSLLMITVYAIIYVWVYLTVLKTVSPRVEKYKILQSDNRTVLALAALIIFIDIIMSSIITYILPYTTLAPLGRDSSFIVLLILHAYNVVCCVLAIILTIELPRRRGAENDLKLVRQLNASKQDQYEAVKANIELINMKVHDLKHRTVELLGDRADGKEMNEINDIIAIYDSAYSTKNEALNVVLMEKSLICKHNNINLSVIADGEKLGFMSDTDIYALFGNILDNAIEAVIKVEGGRSIGLSIKSANSFLIINAFNEFQGELKMSGGLPQTTKKDAKHHGYGLKSIRYIVDKYHGEMTISAKDSVFNLTIAFTERPGAENER
ncbi:MAG: sensor histidine kinase [Clostridiales bacterium]|nr:sensor histidine kinase [Clostridiales bacterium]